MQYSGDNLLHSAQILCGCTSQSFFVHRPLLVCQILSRMYPLIYVEIVRHDRIDEFGLYNLKI